VGLPQASTIPRRFRSRMGCTARSSFLIYFNKLPENVLCAIDRIGPLALLRPPPNLGSRSPLCFLPPLVFDPHDLLTRLVAEVHAPSGNRRMAVRLSLAFDTARLRGILLV